MCSVSIKNMMKVHCSPWEMSGAAADPKTSETACSKFLGNARGANTLPHVFCSYSGSLLMLDTRLLFPVLTPTVWLMIGSSWPWEQQGFIGLHDLRVVTFHWGSPMQERCLPVTPTMKGEMLCNSIFLHLSTQELLKYLCGFMARITSYVKTLS